MQGHPVSYSRSTIIELMIPAYTNFGGKVHGGTLMSMMDKLAYVCASKHAGNYCVTVSVDAVDFLQPVEVGEVVSLLGSVNYVGTKSLVVGIKVGGRKYSYWCPSAHKYLLLHDGGQGCQRSDGNNTTADFRNRRGRPALLCSASAKTPSRSCKKLYERLQK